MRIARLIAVLAGLAAAPLWAQYSPAPEAYEPVQIPDNWSEKKCTLYALIFRDALSLQGHDGLSSRFLSSNQRFIDAGCTGERTLCPDSPEEVRFSDLLTMMTMNEGMASTFVPFGCAD